MWPPLEENTCLLNTREFVPRANVLSTFTALQSEVQVPLRIYLWTDVAISVIVFMTQSVYNERTVGRCSYARFVPETNKRSQ
jgi:hypothetical protein